MVKAVCGHQVRGSTQGEAPHPLCDDCIILATGYLCTPTYRCQVCSKWSDIQWQSVVSHRELLAKRRHDADIAKVNKIYLLWRDLVPRRTSDHPPPDRGAQISEQTATAAVSAVANLYTASQPLQSDSDSSLSAINSFCVSKRHLEFSDSPDSPVSPSPAPAMGKKVRSCKEDSAFDEALSRHRDTYRQQQQVVQPPAVRSTASKRSRDDSSESRRRPKKPRDDRRKLKAVSPASKVQAASTFTSPPPVPRVKVEAAGSAKKSKRSVSVSSVRASTPPPVHTPRPQTSRHMSDSDSDSNSSADESIVDADSFLSAVELSPPPQASQARESSPPPDSKDISFMSVLHMISNFTEAELVEVEPSPSEQWSSDASAPFVALTTTKETALAFNAWRSEFSKKDIKDGVRFGKIYRPSAMKPKVKPYRSGDGVLTTDALSLSPTDYAWLAKAPDQLSLAWSDASSMEVMVRQMIRGECFK